MAENLNNSTRNISISVIIPVYEREKELNKALNSIYEQTVIPDEIIIIDDSKRKLKIKEKFKKNLNLIIIKNSEPVGTSNARNQGIKISKSDYCAFLDSDDYFDKFKLENQIEAVIKKDADFVYGNNILVYENKKIIAKFVEIKKGNEYRDLLNGYNFPNTSTLMISKVLLNKIGGFDGRINCHEDYDIWFKAAKEKAKFCGCNNAITYFSQESVDRLSYQFKYRFKNISVLVENRRQEGLSFFSCIYFENRFKALVIINNLSVCIEKGIFKQILLLLIIIFQNPLCLPFIMVMINKKIIRKTSQLFFL